MRRRRFLALVPAAAAFTLVRCGGGGDDAVARLSTRTTATIGVPTPTPTLTPAPELVLSSETLSQGSTLLVSLVGDVQAGSAKFLGRDLPLTQGARSIYAFVPVGIDDAPGVQQLKVDFTLASGSNGSLTMPITVEATEWPVDAVDIPEPLAALLDPSVARDEEALLAAVYGTTTPEKLWDGGWVMPAAGEISTNFGDQRSYNGAPATDHHTGTDIANSEGTPVVATNSGRVALARQLRRRGNTVVVDHGGGLFSGYAHMSSFAVAQGQAVAQGGTLGYIGSTGLSTGAHLHWEMSAGGVLVDALRFADGTNGF
jgi:murein DD-endopeptidase MepM/ murein hydrolase activator NlpD